MVPVRSKEIFPKPTQNSGLSPCPGHKKKRSFWSSRTQETLRISCGVRFSPRFSVEQDSGLVLGRIQIPGTAWLEPDAAFFRWHWCQFCWAPEGCRETGLFRKHGGFELLKLNFSSLLPSRAFLLLCHSAWIQTVEENNEPLAEFTVLSFGSSCAYYAHCEGFPVNKHTLCTPRHIYKPKCYSRVPF